MKNKTPFDNFNFITITNKGLFNRLHTIIIAKHRFIPNFEFQQSIMNSDLFTNAVNKIYSDIYLASKYGVPANMPTIDFVTHQSRVLKMGAWDEEKQEWYIIDDDNNKHYESEFIPKSTV